MIGETVGQYKILEKLGAGGMGEVFLAEDTKLNRKVALKFLPEKLSSDPEFKSRFKHEAQAAAALNHPNIITVHDLGEYEGRLYIVMEHVTGRTLAELIDADEISIRNALELGAQICDGLSAAHNAGIIHRDIKPANIQVDDNGRARILDFGLAKSRKATTETKAGSTLGTVMYESPEQSRGEVIDQRSDLFSFGSVLYEMITGKLPFPGEYDEAIRYAISHETVEPLSRYKKDVPAELDQVIEKLLEKEPEMRYQTASGVLVDLKRIQRNLTQTTPAVSRIIPAQPGAASALATAPEAIEKSGSKKLVVPTAIVVVLIALALVFKPWKFEIAPSQEAQAKEDRLAIMYFDNLADPNDDMRQGEIIANLLISDISASSELKVVSSQRLYDILKLLGKEGAKTIDRDVASQIADKAKARWMLTGNILRIEPSVVLTAQLVEVETGNVLTSSRINGAEGEDVFVLVDRLTDDITASLGASKSAVSESPSVANLTTTSAEAYRHYLEAWDLQYKFQHSDAERAFSRAIQADSNFAMAYYGRSFVGDNQGVDINKVLKLADRVSEQDRLRILARNALFARDSLDVAIKLYEELVDKYPDDKDAYIRLAQAYNNWPLRDTRSSATYLLKAIEVDPMLKGAYNELAYRYDELGILDSSIWAINQYIRLAPDEPNPYDSRAELHERNGQVEQAIESYEKALAIDPDYGSSMKNLAYLYLFTDNAEKAEELMQERAAHSDRTVRSGGRAGLKNISMYQGKLREAYERYEYKLESDRLEIEKGEHTSWHYFQRRDFAALMYELTGERNWIDSQFAHQDRIHSLDLADTTISTPRDSLVLGLQWWKSRIWLINGEVDSADAILSSRPIRETDTSTIPKLMGYLYSKRADFYFRQDYDTAAYFAERILERDPTFENYINLARVYLEGGQIAEAVHTFERAMNIYDTSRRTRSDLAARIHYWLGRAYEGSNWNEKAIEQYERFLYIWRDADENILELHDAKKRLANLKT